MTSRRREQIEYEQQRLRELMRRNMGSDDDMASRRAARLQRVRMIEAEMLQVQQLHKNAKVGAASFCVTRHGVGACGCCLAVTQHRASGPESAVLQAPVGQCRVGVALAELSSLSAIAALDVIVL